MAVRHHPEQSLLIEYAAGSLAEGKALLVATHLALCPACRQTVRIAEEVGGAMIDDASAIAIGAAPDVSGTRVEARAALTPVSAEMCPVPNPLRSYIGRALKDVPWIDVWNGMQEFPLPQFAGGAGVVRLLAIPGGRRMPQHTHGGSELTLVLQGGFSDVTGAYAVGDVATADPTINHQPTADEGELCLCLAVEDGPLRLTGVTGKFLTAAAAIRGLFAR